MNVETLRIEECAKILGIGRAAAYAAARRGEIPVIRIGNLRLVPRAALEEMLRNPDKHDVRKGEK